MAVDLAGEPAVHVGRGPAAPPHRVRRAKRRRAGPSGALAIGVDVRRLTDGGNRRMQFGSLVVPPLHRALLYNTPARDEAVEVPHHGPAFRREGDAARPVADTRQGSDPAPEEENRLGVRSAHHQRASGGDISAVAVRCALEDAEVCHDSDTIGVELPAKGMLSRPRVTLARYHAGVIDSTRR